jgi:hypothetical protein
MHSPKNKQDSRGEIHVGMTSPVKNVAERACKTRALSAPFLALSFVTPVPPPRQRRVLFNIFVGLGYVW